MSKPFSRSLGYPQLGAGMWDYYRWQLQSTVVTAVLLGPLLCLASWVVLAKQRWIVRALVAVAGLFVWLISASSGMWGGAPYTAGAIGVFWLGLIILIPLRAGLGLSIAWEEQPVVVCRRGQFRIADILGWMAAIACMLTYFRLFTFGNSSQTVAGIVYEAATGLATASVVVVPLQWFVLGKNRRLRRSLIMIGCITLGCVLLAAAYFAVNYFTRRFWWGYPLLEVIQLYSFWMALAVSVFANGWALERLGLRWRCSPKTASQSHPRISEVPA